MLLPLVEAEVLENSALLGQADPADVDAALEHAIWLLAQLRSDNARRLEIESDGTLLAWKDGMVEAADGLGPGYELVPVEPAEWARSLVAQALR